MASRFPPRERSPHRYNDRRQSAPHASSHIPTGPRASDDVNTTPLGREPPRGPKALIDPSRVGAAFIPPGPRGRGFPGRGDFRDRERDRDLRDLRDGHLPFRRDIDRDWSRRDRGFDSRDTRVPFGRGRSRSPPLRDFRDSREPGPRDSDPPRIRRNSRDGPIGSISGLQDASPHRGPSLRGRGRGDRERGRGRGFLDDRDTFRRRSRSRDGWRDRERDLDRDRDRDRDLERPDRFDRRDDDRRSERDERERERLSDRPDVWKKDRPSARVDSKITSTTPATIRPASSMPLSPPTLSTKKGVNPEIEEPNRKLSMQREGLGDPVPEQDPHEHSTVRLDALKDRLILQHSPPPSVTEVPAFGSISSPKPRPKDISFTSPTKARPPDKVSIAESTASKPDEEPADIYASVATAILPPTGPKADRSEFESSHDLRVSRPYGLDIRGKTEVPLRPGRRFPSLSRSPTITTRDAPGLVSASGGKDAVHPSLQADVRTQDIPLGLRVSPRPNSSPGSPPTSQSVGRSISLSRRSGSPPAPPSAPFKSPGPKTSPGIPFASVPTGPRALQRSNVPRGTPKVSNQWVRPGYANRGPSLMNSASPMKRDVFEETDRGSFGVSDVFKPNELDCYPQGEDSKSLLVADRMDNSSNYVKDNVDKVAVKSQAEDHRLRVTTSSITEQVATPLMFGQSSGGESDEEDDLDEEDFNKGEKRFEKEMQALASEMPPPILQDPVIVDLLLQIQMLGIIAEGVVPTCMDLPGAAIEVERPDQPPAVIPVSAKEAQQIEIPGPLSPLTQDHNVPSLEVPSLENLPFLNSGPPTPFSDLDVYQETLQTHDRLKEALRGELVKQRKEVARQHEKLRQEYAGYYKPWRMTVEELDRKSRQEKITTPGPPTPPSATGTATTPGAIAEGRRGYKLNSELDFQNALIASTITAQEEQARRRIKEGPAKPDMSKEALIPDMFEDQERQAFVFKDTNHAVHPSAAFEIFAFHPTPDDFTPEEQKIFTEAFLTHPKKWGKIAEYLPGRDFQACINHYYFTKQEFKYKAKLNRKYVRRRAKKAPATRNPKSNALMSDLGVRPEYEGDEAETPAVTDTGRPRRAAAPTFGEVVPDTENSTPTPGSGKRGNYTKDPAELGVEKAANRRGGRGGGSRGGRRAKVQQPSLTTPIAAAPPKLEAEIKVDAVPELVVTKDREDQKDIASDDLVPRPKSTKARSKEAVYAFDTAELETAAKSLEPRSGSLQPTSYWSVPEQREFPDLIRHFGKDFEAISQYMRTKTPTMVKNYFQRRVDSGQTSLAEFAELAEAKKLSGEPPGPRPIPNISPKRRYEATPSSVAPRLLAPNIENTEPVDVSLASKPKPVAVPLSAANPPAAQPRPQADMDRSQPRFYPLVQATTTPGAPLPVSDETQPRPVRPQPPETQRNQQGPQAGYISDGRRDGRGVMPNTAVLTVQPHEPPSQQLQQNASSMQNPGRGSTLNTQNLPRDDLQPQTQDAQEMFRYQSLAQPPTFSQTQFLHQPQASNPGTPVTRTHSRRASRAVPTSTATSPVQRVSKQELNSSGALRNDTLVQPQSVLPPHNQLLGLARRSPVVSPTKELARPNSTPAQVFPDPPRHVPAKRSNIMNILNDDAEEPPPRKRFANDQPSAANTPHLYSVSHSMSAKSQPVPHDESMHSSRQLQQRRAQYMPQQQHAPQQTQPPSAAPRSYPEYSSYSSGSMAGPGTASQDWMARLDPRGQQQAQATDHGFPRLPAHQTSNLGYGNTAQQQTATSGSNAHQQFQQQHRSSFNPQPPQHVQQSQPIGFQGKSQHQPNTKKRDSPMTLHAEFHPPSPQHRHSSQSYSRRMAQQKPLSPVQITASGLAQPQPHPSYSQGHLNQTQQLQHHSSTGHQLGRNHQQSRPGGGSSQQMQHVGPPSPLSLPVSLRQSQHQQQLPQQQQQPQQLPSLGVGSQHNTDAFNDSGAHLQLTHRASGNVSMSARNSHSNQNLGRSYTPPSALHQPLRSGISYSPGIVPSNSNHALQREGLHQIQQHQHPNLHQHQHQPHSTQSSQTHLRAYSQDSRQ
ncbi:hypothetical protein AJ78_08085 [Emergomyces pasteurianus Ep9510]|uniref:SANT domain-containing protein n=1 Tax=Emergomyces pasteurianus Ep9510 TaxID=1447872 RepID=A0A1J9P2T2_9EURO|nr:hypothetical protein AJ78_08085 [Emergomyces pasteurianus Ep9510]